MADYRFFLSYSRVDAEGGPYMERFFEQLAVEVRRLAALRDTPLREVGFVDQHGEQLGAEWEPELLEALQSSRSLLALCSRAYFQSPTCGQEFEVVRMRREAAAAAGAAPDVILPLLWDPRPVLPKPLPEAMRRIQFEWGDLPASYREVGLLTMLKQPGKYADDYQDLVTKVARRIDDVGKDPPPRVPGLAQLDEVPNAFAPPRRPATTAVALPATSGQGPRTGHFFFMAATRAQMEAVRGTLDAYGAAGALDWRPFHPDCPDRIGLLAQRAASAAELDYVAMPVDADLRDRIRAAETERIVVIVVVDPWVIRVEHFRERLHEYDQANYLNSCVLVAWNDADPETGARAAVLQEELEAALYRTRMNTAELVRDRIRDPHQFRRELRQAIGRVQRRILMSLPVQRRAVGPGAASLPEIRGPSGGMA